MARDVPAARERVRDVLARLNREGSVVASDGSTHALFPVAIPPAEGEALARIVERERPSACIEVGLGYGLSALWICEGLLAGGVDDPRNVALDPYQPSRFAEIGLSSLVEAGVRDLVEHIAEPSEIALPRFLAEGRSFDFAFVDGNHRFDGVFVDLVYLGRLLRPGAAIFLDDAQLPSVAKATAFCVRDLGWVQEGLSPPDPHHRWAVLRTSARPDARPFDHFVDF